MSNLKISEMLSADSPLSGLEIIPVVQNGNNVSVSVNEIRGVGGESSTSVQAALDLKANLNSPTFTGNPQSNAAPASGDHLTNKTYVDAKVDVKQPAFYTVEISNSHNYTDPASFTASTVAATFDMYSKGTIAHGLNNIYAGSTNSFLYTMNVKVLSDTEITLYNYANDDSMYIYLDGVLHSSYSNRALTDNPRSVTFTLQAGDRKVQVVKNDSGSGSNNIELYGNIISSTVEFISGK